MTFTQHQLTFIAGGTGKTGRRVAARLDALGHPIRIGSRSAPIPFDWDRPNTWPEPLAGAHQAYVAYSPDIAFPGAVDRLGEFSALAKRSGVERLVLLSGRGEPEAQAAEQVVMASGVDTTVVRCSLFAQNFSEDFLADAVRESVIALPAGDVAEPILDADDIADVAVAALTMPGHSGRVHELTGPELLTFHDIAAELSIATGRHISYVPVSPSEFAAGAIAAGMSGAEAEAVAELFAFIFDGHNATLSSGVADVLGRPARRFGEYASSASAMKIWDVAA